MIDYLDHWSFQSYFRPLLGVELAPFDRRWSIRRMIIGSLRDTDLLHRAARTSDDDCSHLSCHLRWCPCRPWRPVLTSRGGVPQVHGYSALKSTALLTKVCVWRRDIDLRTETKPPISCRLSAVRLASRCGLMVCWNQAATLPKCKITNKFVGLRTTRSRFCLNTGSLHQIRISADLKSTSGSGGPRAPDAAVMHLCISRLRRHQPNFTSNVSTSQTAAGKQIQEWVCACLNSIPDLLSDHCSAACVCVCVWTER